MKSFHSAKQQVCGHGIEARTRDLTKMINAPYEIGAAAHHTAERIRVPTEKLGGAVKDEIGTEFHRLLIDGRGQCVVHNHHGTATVGYLRQAIEIDNFHSRIGWTFQIQRLAPSTNRSEEHTSELQSLRHLVCRLL